MGSETRTGESRAGSGESTNVVRIPRDWFGPKDDLVPFGPGAAESASAHNGRDSRAPLDAESFWGEDADSIQDVLEARPAPPAGRRTWVAAALVVLVASAGAATWLRANSSHSRSQPEIAALGGVGPSVVGRVQPGDTAARRLAGARSEKPATRYPSTQARRATPVVYHATQATAPPTFTPTGSGAPSEGGTLSSPAVVSTTTAAQPAQPAFGANGALGPMSSPAG